MAHGNDDTTSTKPGLLRRHRGVACTTYVDATSDPATETKRTPHPRQRPTLSFYFHFPMSFCSIFGHGDFKDLGEQRVTARATAVQGL